MSRPAHRLLPLAMVSILLLSCSSDPASSDPGAELGVDTREVSDALTDATLDGDLSLDAEGGEASSELPGDGAPEVHDGESEAAEADAPVEWTYPDPAFVHVLTGPALTSAGAAYETERVQMYRLDDGLPGLQSTAFSGAGGGLYLGGALGLTRYDTELDAFVKEPLPGGSAAVTDIAETLDPGKRLVVVSAERIDYLDTVNGGGESLAFPGGILSSVAVDGASTWLGTDQGLRRIVGNFPELVEGAQGFAVVDLAVTSDGMLWLATNLGLRRYDGQSVVPVLASDGHVLDDDVRALAVDEDSGALWVASGTGLSRYLGELWTRFPAGIDGLPADDLRAVAAHGDDVLLAHGRGATWLRLDPDGSSWSSVDHYVSARWLPSDEARAVALGASGEAWVGTTAGLSKLERGFTNLGAKEAAMESLLAEHFWRMDGFVAPGASVDDAWSPEEWRLGDSDNDGLWTQMQIGAWCYAHAATGDETFYTQARKAMDTMFLLVDVPTADFEAAGLGRGFVARSLVRDDEGAVFEAKAGQSNWHLVDYEGRQYYWKDDTSSDEVDGHFFGYPLFYDLCAKTDEERAAVAEHATAITRAIIDGGYYLRDLDGEKTGYGHWAPEVLAVAADGLNACYKDAQESDDPAAHIESCLAAWAGEGWLNSVQILGVLLASWHMTGDELFYDEYERLIRDHKYDLVATPHEETFTIVLPSIMNHSDHELAMLAYHTLIRYEPNEDRRALWIQGLRFLYDWERVERNPLWAGFVAVLAGAEHADLEASLQSLREIPTDRRDWRVDNSHRKDAALWPNDRFGKAQFDRVFPYDEIRTVWWNGNLHVLVDGGDGRGVSGPMATLLPYWLLRYSGAIGE